MNAPERDGPEDERGGDGFTRAGTFGPRRWVLDFRQGPQARGCGPEGHAQAGVLVELLATDEDSRADEGEHSDLNVDGKPVGGADDDQRSGGKPESE